MYGGDDGVSLVGAVRVGILVYSQAEFLGFGGTNYFNVGGAMVRWPTVYPVRMPVQVVGYN